MGLFIFINLLIVMLNIFSRFSRQATAEQTKEQIHTTATTETAQSLSGSLKNRFDADKVQSELDLQREVSQQFAPVAVQTVAWTADKLGNIQNYERVQIAKANYWSML